MVQNGWPDRVLQCENRKHQTGLPANAQKVQCAHIQWVQDCARARITKFGERIIRPKNAAIFRLTTRTQMRLQIAENITAVFRRYYHVLSLFIWNPIAHFYKEIDAHLIPSELSSMTMNWEAKNRENIVFVRARITDARSISLTLNLCTWELMVSDNRYEIRHAILSLAGLYMLVFS